ncbi:MAG: penicillin-binding protein 1C [Candidatus Fibromonas sp.]|jgi:penicillin-binding protein 1C|nr:penicillin-binding protein 1C [Candidatus Fibromonas sp.]
MRKKLLLILSGLTLLAFLTLLVPPQTEDDCSKILFDNQGELLRVWLNKNEQYKFPKSEKISEKYRAAVLHFEDRRFNWHFGIDPAAVLRAVKQNLQAGRVESGASTITMQIARLKNPSERTFFAKFKETHTALRMELWKSKDEIFAEYASIAPMGGNVVGAETACWRFFGHGLEEITWAEAALLALLPNRPSALNLEKERGKLLERRNNLLKSLAKAGYISTETLNSSLQEPLPKTNANWRFGTPHYAEAVLSLFPNQTILHGTIDGKIQEKLELVTKNYGKRMREYIDINISVLAVETKTGKIRGYMGSLEYYDTLSKGMIDGVRAHRSTGSILKPFLYALAIERGPYTPESLIEDIPTWFKGFSPQNADKDFSGILPLKEALIQSLNVPAVKILSEYGVEDFHFWLKNAGLDGLFRTPEGYGLSLILGGGEASLKELVPLYSMLMNNGKRTELKWIESGRDSTLQNEQLLQGITAYHIREILNSVKDHSQIPVAWKTGTSYGSRDAWAIGVNEQWTIGVWAGNFAGGSVANLSGSSVAAPLLFSLFNNLSDNKKKLWKGLPEDADYENVEICRLSGYKAKDICPHKKNIKLPVNIRQNQTCPFHKEIIISKSTGYEVCSLCWNLEDTLRTVKEHYTPAVRSELRKKGREPNAETLHNPSCPAKKEEIQFSIVYPENGARLFLPSGDALNTMGFIAIAAHKQKNAELQWFLDGAFLGSTKNEHKMAVTVGSGEHRIGAQDSLGVYLETRFRVRAK